jgi:hypothetical protein
MTELEHRLRPGPDKKARRPAPAGPRPHRQRAGWTPRPPAQWLAPAAMIAVSAMLAGPGLAACGRAAGPAPPGGRPAAADPPVVAIAGSSARGSSSRIELMSPRTGRVTKVLARVSTGNGLALSPDSKFLYVVGPAGPAIEIRRISVATGKVSVVADGAYPAVSPDGRYLAYATGDRFSKVAVRDLSTGSTRVIDLRSLLGSGSNLLNQGAITWLGDGDEVIVVPGIAASAAAAVVTAGGGGGGGAGAGGGGGGGAAGGDQVPPGRQSLVIVKIRPDGLAARRIVVPDPYQEPFLVISGDLSRQRAVLIARMGFAAAGTITRVILRGRGYETRVMAKLPRGAMPVAIAPRGDRVLYLVGHGPPVLWTADIEGGRLTGQHRLLTDTSKFGLDQAAW